ncbi:DUF3093 domain-containing protein [Gordonia caeni]|uniref:DUF3093 domain-containing protein n=1 Tax=Gordonia caeni TaxID=1007097 RepID=A0ABP7NP35_9ACTN
MTGAADDAPDAGLPGDETGATEPEPAPDPELKADPELEAEVEAALEIDEGEVLFDEPGGSWWVVSIGPIMIAAVLIMEIVGGGRIHWPVLTIFGVILVGFTLLQVAAARKHVSVRLTETALHQGAQTIALSDIAEVYPENRTGEHEKWESARALGELPAVPRRRKGVGVKLADGKLRQAWARDVDRFRTELTEAHLAVEMGLEPKKRS